jgi:transglutaminase-like putative cysteine protease
MPAFTIRHATTYTYSAPVTLGLHRLYLRPRADHKLKLNSASLTLYPAAEVVWRNDVYGNSLAVARFAHDTDRLEIVSELEVETFPRSEEQRRMLLEAAHEAPSTQSDRALAPFLEIPDEERATVAAWIDQASSGANKSQYERLLECAARIRFEFDYRLRFEEGIQSPADTLLSRSGTCRDFAALMMAASRTLGSPARFVTGYVWTPNAAPGSLAPHAWAETYLPGAGWIELDATNGLVDDGDLIPVAASLSGEALSPVSGSFTGAASSGLTVSVDVQKTG